MDYSQTSLYFSPGFYFPSSKMGVITFDLLNITFPHRSVAKTSEKWDWVCGCALGTKSYTNRRRNSYYTCRIVRRLKDQDTWLPPASLLLTLGVIMEGVLEASQAGQRLNLFLPGRWSSGREWKLLSLAARSVSLIWGFVWGPLWV